MSNYLNESTNIVVELCVDRYFANASITRQLSWSRHIPSSRFRSFNSSSLTQVSFVPLIGVRHQGQSSAENVSSNSICILQKHIFLLIIRQQPHHRNYHSWTPRSCSTIFCQQNLLKTNFYFRRRRVVNFNRQDVLAVVSKPMRFIAFF